LEIGGPKFGESFCVELAFKLLQKVCEFYATRGCLGPDLITLLPHHLRKTSKSADERARFQGAAETTRGAARATRVIGKCIYKLGGLGCEINAKDRIKYQGRVCIVHAEAAATYMPVE